MVGYSRIGLLLLVMGLAVNVWGVEKIQVMGLFKDKAIVVIDGKQRLLRVGEPSADGVILVAANSKEAIIEVNGREASYRLGSEISTTFDAPAKAQVVHIWPTLNGMYAVQGSINGHPLGFVVDTGASWIALNANQAKRLGIDYRTSGRMGYSETASGMVKTYYVNLRRVKVGSIELSNVKAAVVDGAFPTIALLGMSFLNRVQIRRDGAVMELRKKY